MGSLELRLEFRILGHLNYLKLLFLRQKKDIPIEFTIFISNETILLKKSTLFYLTLGYDGGYMLQFSILGLNFSELGG